MGSHTSETWSWWLLRAPYYSSCQCNTYRSRRIETQLRAPWRNNLWSLWSQLGARSSHETLEYLEMTLPPNPKCVRGSHNVEYCCRRTLKVPMRWCLAATSCLGLFFALEEVEIKETWSWSEIRQQLHRLWILPPIESWRKRLSCMNSLVLLSKVNIGSALWNAV